MSDSRRQEYLELLDQISELQRKEKKLEKEITQLRDRTHFIHSQLLLEIGLARDDKGKPVYSNESLRRAALNIKLQEHNEFLELRNKIRSIDEEIDEISINYNKLIDHKFLLMAELGIAFESEMTKYPSVN